MICKPLAAALILFVTPFNLAQTPVPAPSAQPISDTTPLKVGGDVLVPILIHSAEPKFPSNLSAKTLDAVVLIGLVVDTAGKPSNIHIVRSDDSELDKAAMNAVAKYRFKPATLHDKPVPVELKVQIRFQKH